MSQEMVSLNRQLIIHEKNLVDLEVKKAKFGLEVPLYILRQIEDEKSEISRLKQMIQTIKSEEVPSTVPKEQAASVFNTYIYGSHNVVATGSQVSQEVHQQVRVNDIDSLLNYMKQIGLPTTDVEELSKAIAEDGRRVEPNKFGSKVTEWIGKLTKKIGEGAWKVAIGITSALIAKAISIYYGWE